jgi:hypothetical protein
MTFATLAHPNYSKRCSIADRHDLSTILLPKEGTELVWKFVQYYDDGTKEEFTGPVGSRLPAPVVALKAPAGK